MKIKRIMSCLLAFLLVFTMIPISAKADGGLSVSTSQTGQWGSTWQYSISLQNNFDTPVTSWEVCIETSTDLGNASINGWSHNRRVEGNKIYLSGLDWNSRIESGSGCDGGGIEITVGEDEDFSVVGSYVSSYQKEEKQEEPTQEEIIEEVPTNEDSSNEEESPSNEVVEEQPIEEVQEVVEEKVVAQNYVGQNLNNFKDSLESWGKDNNIKIEYAYDYFDDKDVDTCVSQSDIINNTLTLMISLGSKDVIEEESHSNNFNILGDIGVNIDGNYSDWDKIAASYEYNWDNSSNAWDYGVWIDGECFKTPRGTYDTNVRHKVQLASDGAYVYLHIVFSRDYSASFNGENYQFFLDDNQTNFRITRNGESITNNINSYAPGTYEVEVRHEGGSMSGEVVNGSRAYVTKKGNGKNAELEIKIPVSEMVKQNTNIQDNFSKVEFFTPNLMYRRVTTTCTPTMPTFLIPIFFVVGVGFFGGLYGRKIKKSKNL